MVCVREHPSTYPKPGLRRFASNPFTKATLRSYVAHRFDVNAQKCIAFSGNFGGTTGSFG